MDRAWLQPISQTVQKADYSAKLIFIVSGLQEVSTMAVVSHILEFI